MLDRKLIPQEYYRDTPKWAVIVGISEYEHKPWNLEYAHRDAEELYKLLQTGNGGNFKRENIRLLTNQKATKANLVDALRDFLHRPDKDDLVLLYFACHGTDNPKISRDKNLYLVTHDTNPDKIASTALEMGEINKALRDILESEKIIILADTCHSGGINLRGINNEEINDSSERVTKYFQQLNNSKGGTVIFTSAEATQKSQESSRWGDGHGVFTHYLLEGMRGKALADNNGIITAGELFEYVRESVKRETKGQQIPFIDANKFDRRLPLAITDINEGSTQIEPIDNLEVEDKTIEVEENASEEIADVETIFRQAVVELIDENNKINPVRNFKLTKLAKKLGILDKAKQLKDDEILRMVKFQKTALEKAELAKKKKIEQIKLAKEEYITVLKNLIDQGYYPFSKEITRELKDLQLELELSDEQVTKISKEILEKAELDYKIKVRIKEFSFDVITVDSSGQEISKTSKTVDYFNEYLGNGVELAMVAIPGGEFLMGTEDAEIRRLNKKFELNGFNGESPQHRVKISPFFMSRYPITQAQYQAIMGTNPSEFSNDPNNPVEKVSWDDAKEFCQKLCEKTELDYRLPSEAEWEYAARAGTITPFYFGETITTNLANYRGIDMKWGDKTYSGNYADEPSGEYRKAPTPVRRFPPNSFGLCDIHGNVWEWCKDDWHDNYKVALSNGSVWLSGNNSDKVIRGGSWDGYPYYCRSAYRRKYSRNDRDITIGFRVVCVTLEGT